MSASEQEPKQIREELNNRRVNKVARGIWEEALLQPEFGHVEVIYGYAPMTTSDHRNGRCCDFMITIPGIPRDHQVAIGDGIRRYFKDNSERLHVEGIIWNRHVTGFPETEDHGIGPQPHPTYRGPSGVAREYTGTSSHTDHVHVQVSGEEPTHWLHHKEEDPMPTPDQLWNADDIPAPNIGQTAADLKDNPTWKAKNALRTAVQEAHDAKVLGQENAKKLDTILKLLTPADVKS